MVNGENIQTHSSINILVFNQKQSEEEDFRERQCVNILTVFLPQKNKKKVKLFRIERMLIKFCLILLVTFPVVNVLSKAALSNMNLEVEKLKSEISRQKNSNESLNMKVNELKSLANIDIIADNAGLSYNSDNVKVISNN